MCCRRASEGLRALGGTMPLPQPLQRRLASGLVAGSSPLGVCAALAYLSLLSNRFINVRPVSRAGSTKAQAQLVSSCDRQPTNTHSPTRPLSPWLSQTNGRAVSSAQLRQLMHGLLERHATPSTPVCSGPAHQAGAPDDMRAEWRRRLLAHTGLSASLRAGHANGLKGRRHRVA